MIACGHDDQPDPGQLDSNRRFRWGRVSCGNILEAQLLDDIRMVEELE
jgi:hypothetical protein